MGSYSDFPEIPWINYSVQNDAYDMLHIRHVVIEEGVTSVSNGLFTIANNLSSVSLPSTLQSVGNLAFGSYSLHEVAIPESVTSIGSGAFGYYRSSYITPNSLIPLNKVSDFNIIGTAGSEAENYASLNGFKFNGEDPPPVVKGTTGESEWSFDADTGVMTISGNGAMGDYDSLNSPAPLGYSPRSNNKGRYRRRRYNYRTRQFYELR